jgi:hypothetical protein
MLSELDALEADMGTEMESSEVPSYLQPDKEPEHDAELSLPPVPSGHAQPQVLVQKKSGLILCIMYISMHVAPRFRHLSICNLK